MKKLISLLTLKLGTKMEKTAERRSGENSIAFIPNFTREILSGLPRLSQLNPFGFNWSALRANFANAKFGFIPRTTQKQTLLLELVSVPFYIISENKRCYGYNEQNNSDYHFSTPFKITSPPIKNRRAQIRPSINTKSLSGMLVNTYMPTISFEISRKYLPKFDIWFLLNSISEEYYVYYSKSRKKVSLTGDMETGNWRPFIEAGE